MKSRYPTLRHGLLAASTGLAIALAAPVAAAPAGGMQHHGCGPMSRLSVTGSGESRIAPDLAVVSLGVTSQAESATEAMRDNSNQQAAVIEALRGAGLQAADIQTSGVNLSPLMDYGDGRAPRITGYRASNMVSVRVADVARLGEVMDAIVAAGANEINGISFQREDSASAEDDARRAAVDDARRKAEVLSAAAGLTLGPVLTIRDAPQSQGPAPVMMRAEMAAQDSGTPIEAGELSVSAEIQIVYALLGQDGACMPAEPALPDEAE